MRERERGTRRGERNRDREKETESPYSPESLERLLEPHLVFVCHRDAFSNSVVGFFFSSFRETLNCIR